MDTPRTDRWIARFFDELITNSTPEVAEKIIQAFRTLRKLSDTHVPIEQGLDTETGQTIALIQNPKILRGDTHIQPNRPIRTIINDILRNHQLQPARPDRTETRPEPAQ